MADRAMSSNVRQVLREDLRAYGLMRWSWWLRWKYPTLHLQRHLRRAEHYRESRTIISRPIYTFHRFRLKQVGIKLGITLPLGVFGPGLTIAHYGSLVVNDHVRAGARVRIHNNVNIGTKDGLAPVIGDGVYIGPGAVIYGGITIGNGSVIAANAVVGRDVPPGVTVAGAPARIIANRGSESLMPSGPEG